MILGSYPSETRQRHGRFHGRVEGRQTPCAIAGCEKYGEFRATPEGVRGTSDRPGAWRWLCLDHAREYNKGYNYLSGMTTDEIQEAQRPYAGWERETREIGRAACRERGVQYGENTGGPRT